MATKNLVFVLVLDDVGIRYKSCTITLKSLQTKDTVAEFSWQTNTDDDDRHWYGFDVCVCASDLDTFNDKVAVVRRILRVAGRRPNPADMFMALEKLNIPQVVYDSRVCDFVLLPDILPEEYSRWIDDYKTLGYEHCHVAVFATSAEQAKWDIVKALAECKYSDVLEKFMAYGMPVLCAGGSKPSVVMPSDVLLVTNQV